MPSKVKLTQLEPFNLSSVEPTAWGALFWSFIAYNLKMYPLNGPRDFAKMVIDSAGHHVVLNSTIYRPGDNSGEDFCFDSQFDSVEDRFYPLGTNGLYGNISNQPNFDGLYSNVVLSNLAHFSTDRFVVVGRFHRDSPDNDDVGFLAYATRDMITHLSNPQWDIVTLDGVSEWTATDFASSGPTGNHVVVGMGGIVFQSPDSFSSTAAPTTWTQENIPRAVDINKVKFANSQFVCGGRPDAGNGYIFYSTDGTAPWTEVFVDSSVEIHDLAWSSTASLWYILAGNTIYTWSGTGTTINNIGSASNVIVNGDRLITNDDFVVVSNYRRTDEYYFIDCTSSPNTVQTYYRTPFFEEKFRKHEYFGPIYDPFRSQWKLIITDLEKQNKIFYSDTPNPSMGWSNTYVRHHALGTILGGKHVSNSDNTNGNGIPGEIFSFGPEFLSFTEDNEILVGSGASGDFYHASLGKAPHLTNDSDLQIRNIDTNDTHFTLLFRYFNGSSNEFREANDTFSDFIRFGGLTGRNNPGLVISGASDLRYVGINNDATTFVALGLDEAFRKDGQFGSWSSVTVPAGFDVNDVKHITGNIWVVAADNDTIWRSTDDGASWSSTTTGFLTGNGATPHWNHITITETGRVLVFGIGVGRQTLAYSDDGGATWLQVDLQAQGISSNGGVIQDTTVIPDFSGAVVAIARSMILITIDDGLTWAYYYDDEIDFAGVSYLKENEVSRRLVFADGVRNILYFSDKF